MVATDRVRVLFADAWGLQTDALEMLPKGDPQRRGEGLGSYQAGD